uniref:Endoplasmic reticulum-based factor for assembly of V-ATPase n=1 Tax=Bondarzewia mesenterica TaxID=1095465 RepID=A0A4S4LNA9_9AGAM
MADTFKDLTTSLEPHLLDTLRPLLSLLPPALDSELSPYLSPTPHASSTQTIPYPLLLAISKWSRTAPGLSSLHSATPPLDPNDYTMIALLAGTRTSPHRKFPPVIRTDPAREAKRAVNDKRMIVGVLNALLSVVGAGAGTWVAAQRTGWRDEWKVLLSFLVAAAVALSETVLYIIHDSRRARQNSGSAHPQTQSQAQAQAQARAIPASERRKLRVTQEDADPGAGTPPSARVSSLPLPQDAALRHRGGVGAPS